MPKPDDKQKKKEREEPKKVEYLDAKKHEVKDIPVRDELVYTDLYEELFKKMPEYSLSIIRKSNCHYGVKFPSMNIAKKPIFQVQKLRPEDCHTRDLETGIAHYWIENESEIETYKMGYVEKEVRAKILEWGASSILGYDSNFDKGHKMKDHCMFSEYIIPKGVLDLSSVYNKEKTTQEFKDFFNNKDVNIKNIKLFWDEFGESFPTKIVYGGKRFVVETFASLQLAKEGKNSIEANLTGSFPLTSVIMEAEASAGKKNKTRRATLLTSQINRIQTRGGAPENSISVAEWLTSLKNHLSWAVIRIQDLKETISYLDQGIQERIRKCLKEEEERLKRNISEKEQKEEKQKRLISSSLNPLERLIFQTEENSLFSKFDRGAASYHQKEFSECGNSKKEGNVSTYGIATTGEAYAQFNIFDAMARGPTAAYGTSAGSDGVHALVKAEVARVEANAGPIGIAVGLNVNSGIGVGPNGFHVSVLGFGVEFGWPFKVAVKTPVLEISL